VRNRRADAIEKLIDVSEKFGVKLPPLTKEVVVHEYRYSTENRYTVLFRLLQARAALAERGPAGAAAARAIDRMLGTP
jgi:hypothetical protein